MSEVHRKEVRSTLSSRSAAARAVPPQELWFYVTPFALGAAVFARLSGPSRDLSERDIADAFGDFA